MNFVKYIPYFYIVFALFFLYDVYLRYTNNENYIISLVFVAVAIFMFFFRRRFNDKLKNRQK